MPLPGRLFSGDEDLGKKNDDHKPSNGVVGTPSWSNWKTTLPRVRRRRLILALIACFVIYIFVQNIPTDLGPQDSRYDLRTPKGSLSGGTEASATPPTGAPPRAAGDSDVEKRYYNGQIRFYWLAASLHGIAKTMGYREVNKNVLFAAGNLRSASRLIPMACEMSRWNRNFVHFAFIGRDEISLAAIQEVNGVGTDCEIYWHDARPDYPSWSTDYRMEVSVNAALGHMQSFMHPQVIITEDFNHEEAFFTKGARAKAQEIDTSIIELSKNAAEKLRWITRLDSGSLSAWHKSYVDILIQAPSGSSGSLLRLLRSIEAADYFGARRPHLTIELPADIDPQTRQYLENLVWPPIESGKSPHVSQVTLKHRILRQKLGTEEASLRFVESFYPARPKDSHVLLLSPQVELSPLFYHYLFYNILEYKYSSYGAHYPELETLMGLSLELPSRQLNDRSPFIAPPSPPGEEPLPFLWQAPNSNAALYFGDKWIELHSFLASRISALRAHSPSRPKRISEKYPAWTEYLLELIRARDYTLLYPRFLSSDAIVTVHNEMYQAPEEFSYARSSLTRNPHLPAEIAPYEAFAADPATHSLAPSSNLEPPLLITSLISILPQNGDLPDLQDVPLLSYNCELLTPAQSVRQAQAFVQEFRRDIGRCLHSNEGIRIQEPMKADDLFCSLDEYDGSTMQQAPPRQGNGVNDWLVAGGGQPQKELDPDSADTKREVQAHLARQAGKGRGGGSKKAKADKNGGKKDMDIKAAETTSVLVADAEPTSTRVPDEDVWTKATDSKIHDASSMGTEAVSTMTQELEIQTKTTIMPTRGRGM